MTTNSPTQIHWLIWDGDCTFCGNAVSWFRELDRDEQFTIIPTQNCPSPPMTPELKHESNRSMIVITNDGHEIFGGRAVMFVLEQTGWHTRLVWVLNKRPFIWAVNAGYRIVANNRRIFSRILFPSQSGCEVRYHQKDMDGPGL